MSKVRKAIIPAAGLGRRLLPFTLVVPKEFLPVGREPILVRALREIREAGLDHAAVIVSRRDDLTGRFLFGSPPAELRHERSVMELREILSGLEIEIIVQPEPRGLGDALGLARGFAGNDPFAVLLPDNVFFGSRAPLSQIVPVFEREMTHVTGLIKTNSEEAATFGNCGAVDVEKTGNGEYRVIGIGDKGKGYFSLEKGREVLRWYARHIFLPSFFEHLDRYSVEKNGEVDDVPVLKAMAREERIVGKLLEGKGFDVGNERGLMAAQRFLWEEVSRDWS